MTQLQQRPGAIILSRLLEPVENIMPVSFARELAAMRARPEEQARIDELAGKANEGLLTDDERAEYAAYIDAMNIIGILQAKARSVLAKQSDV